MTRASVGPKRQPIHTTRPRKPSPPITPAGGPGEPIGTASRRGTPRMYQELRTQLRAGLTARDRPARGLWPSGVSLR
jgi:hypothetical protein